jgi:anaerobic selenocysteine-containing dehydrogenase
MVEREEGETRMTHVAQVTCPHDCPDSCLIDVTVVEGRATRVAASKEHPFTRGALCAKVNKLLDRVYAPDRLLHPVRRIGPKGPGARFERISWDAAIDTIAAKMTEWRSSGGTGQSSDVFSMDLPKSGTKMKMISNKTQKPLSVPLPRGKTLHLGPGRTAEVASNACDYAPLKRLVESAEIEIFDEPNEVAVGAGGGRAGRPWAGPHASGSASRRSGDR